MNTYSHIKVCFIPFLLFLTLMGLTRDLYATTSYYYDIEGNIKLNQLQEKDFTPFISKIDKGLENGTYWIKIAEPKGEIVELQSPRLKSVECFQNGVEIPEFENSLFPVFKIETQKTCYVRVVCEKEALIPVETYQEASFLKKDRYQFLFVGVYYGFVIMVLIFNFFYFFNFKDYTFLWYFFFLLTVNLTLFHSDGVPHALTNNAAWAQNMPAITHILASICGGIFASVYLQHENYFPKLKYTMIGVNAIGVISVGAYLFTNNVIYYAVSDLAVLITLSTYWFSGVLLWNTSIFSRFFTVAYFLILFLAIDFYIGPMWGWQIIGVTPLMLKLGGFAEMLVLSYAVIYRMQALQKESEQMQQELFVYTSKVDELQLQLENIQKGEENTITEADLSQRELEVLTYISEGKTNKEMADLLFVSVNTIKYHTKKLYDKLEINSRQEAKQKAFEIQVVT